jgi:hypothetical protein
MYMDHVYVLPIALVRALPVCVFYMWRRYFRQPNQHEAPRNPPVH